MVEAVVPMLVTAIPVLLVEGLVQMPATVVLVEQEMPRLPHQHREIMEEPLLTLPPQEVVAAVVVLGQSEITEQVQVVAMAVQALHLQLPEVLLLTLVAAAAVLWMEARVQVVPVVVETVTKD
jgi:hypothetical protein